MRREQRQAKLEARALQEAKRPSVTSPFRWIRSFDLHPASSGRLFYHVTPPFRDGASTLLSP
jgi:hypothetical protein